MDHGENTPALAQPPRRQDAAVADDDAAPGGKGRRPGGKGGGRKKGPPPVVEVRPVAGPARMQRRHWGLIASLVLVVLAPLAATIVYLWVFAQDQYASTTGFTVRQEETGSASDLLGGLAQFAGGGSSTNTDVLYEFIQSQEIVERVNEQIDLAAHYSRHWPGDPVFAIPPEASIEDLLSYWNRVVRTSYDQGSGLIDVEVRAYDPETAQEIARLIVDESQAMINTLNDSARSDTMRYAEADLAEALERLRAAREALTEFRVRTQIVDPEADIQGRMGVINNLQQQLATALVDYDLLLQSTDEGDPRRRQAERRIEVIRERISEERADFSTQDVTGEGTDYPSLMAEYESLRVDREFAEETYRAALTALDAARSNAARQSLYLATYIRPTLPQSAEYPDRPLLAGLALLFLTMIWGIGALVFYSLRDRR